MLNKNVVICFFTFLFLTRIFNCAIFVYFPILEIIYARVSQFTALYVLILYVFFYKKISMSIVLVTIYTGVLFISTRLGSGNYYNIIQRIYPVLSFLMFMEIQIKQHHAQNFMKAIANTCFALTVIEFVLLPVSELCWGEYIFFLSGRNQMYIGFAIGILSIYYYYGIHSMFFKLYLGISLVCILYGGSSNNLLAIIFFIFVMAIGFNKKVLKIVLNFSVLFGYPLLNMGVVVFRIHEYFGFLIEGILHKSITLTSRTYIWDTALELIKQSPVWGYGVANNGNVFHVVAERINAPNIDAWYSGHNQYIQALYEGGFIFLIIVLIWIIYASNKINKFMMLSDASVTYAIIFSLLIVMMAEAPGWDSIFIVLFLSHLQISCYEERRQCCKYAKVS